MAEGCQCFGAEVAIGGGGGLHRDGAVRRFRAVGTIMDYDGLRMEFDTKVAIAKRTHRKTP